MSKTWRGSLHSHSEYSNLRLRDSINKLKETLWMAAKLGNTVVGLTDHDNLSSHLKAERIARDIQKEYPDFRLIRGNEIYLCRNGLNADNYNKETDGYWHFILLARDATGYKQLRKISTRAWDRSYMARGMRRVPTYYQDLFDIIGENSGHVIGSTACLGGVIPRQILKAKETNDIKLLDNIKKWLLRMNQLFGQDNFYLEMQPSNNPEQIYVNKELLKYSKELNIPYIITTDAHYGRPEDRKIHKAYLNAQNGDREVDDFYATTYFMTEEEIKNFFSYFSDEELETAFENIDNIANKCEDYTLERPLNIPRMDWKIPTLLEVPQKYIDKINYLDKFVNSDFEGDQILARAIIQKVESDPRLQNEKTYEAIADNLEKTWISSEVNKAHWSSYFLNLQKIVEECWNAGTLVGPARGSGAGFVLLYLLDIIQVNPLWEKTKTYSYRFLNPARVSVLDIDTDIEGGKRKQVIRHLQKVYGEDRVSQVATFKTEKSKAAILTAARGLGIDVDIANYIASMIVADRGLPRTLKETYYGDEEKGFKPNKEFVYEMTENYPELWEVAQAIEGLICGYSSHAGGIIFVDEPFYKSTSLMRTPKGEIITALDLHDCEASSQL